MKYGYASVSTDDQNPALQLAALKKAKCAHIFEDRLSGATTKRPALARCLKTLQEGDTLTVWKLDRLDAPGLLQGGVPLCRLVRGQGTGRARRREAAIRMLFDWLVVGHVLDTNPAHAVRGPKSTL